MNKTNLPNNLYELRRSAGLSQEKFAEKLFVSRQAVSKWERGEAYPDIDNLITISEMFGVTIDELLKGDTLSDTTEPENTENEPTEDSDEEKHGFGISLEIGDKVSINVGKGAEDDFDLDDEEDDEDEEDEDEGDRKKSKLSIWYTVPYPVVMTIAFLAVGLFFNGWYWAWTFFMTIPVYYSLLDSIRKKRFTEFAYPVFVAFLYCLFGMLFSWWHPGWIMFVTIPVYYPIAEGIDRYTKNKNQ